MAECGYAECRMDLDGAEPVCGALLAAAPSVAKHGNVRFRADVDHSEPCCDRSADHRVKCGLDLYTIVSRVGEWICHHGTHRSDLVYGTREFYFGSIYMGSYPADSDYS